MLEKVALKGLPDETCTLDIYEDSRYGYIKENVINVDEMNCSLVNINICFTSYFTFISQQFVGPNISKFTARINHLKPPYSKPHFRLIISFDEYGNLNSEQDKGNTVCPCDQYFDILSSQCKNKIRFAFGNNTLSYMNSTFPSEYFKKNTMESTFERVYQCIKQLGGVGIQPNSTLKKVDSIETRGRFRDVLGKLGKSLHQVFVPIPVHRVLWVFPTAPFFAWKDLRRSRND